MYALNYRQLTYHFRPSKFFFKYWFGWDMSHFEGEMQPHFIWHYHHKITPLPRAHRPVATNSMVLVMVCG